MYNFNNLKVYRRADLFSDVIHSVTKIFPIHEKFALGDQMNRAVDSVVLNICEGGGAETNADTLLYLRHAVKSCNEVEGIIGRAWKLGYLKDGEKDYMELRKEVIEIRNMLFGFMKRFR